MPPTLANGKICYIEMPTVDVNRSSKFYEEVFGWRIRRRNDGSIAFDDGVGEVSGTWILDRPPATSPGLLIYIMVDNVAATIDAVLAHGGELVQPIGVDAPEITARCSQMLDLRGPNRAFERPVRPTEIHESGYEARL